MAFKFKCKYCDQHIEAEDFMVGNEFFCPSCNQPLIVPAVDRITELDEIQPVQAPGGYFRSEVPPPPPELPGMIPQITGIYEKPSCLNRIIAVLACVNTVLLLAVLVVLIIMACGCGKKNNGDEQEFMPVEKVAVESATESVQAQPVDVPVNTVPRRTKSSRR